jgi:hypothetical protein
VKALGLDSELVIDTEVPSMTGAVVPVQPMPTEGPPAPPPPPLPPAR